MKNRKRLNHWLIAVALLTATALLWAARAWQVNAMPAARLDAAWEQTQQLAAYRFTTELTQTTYPAAAIGAVGQHPRAESLVVDGHIDRPSATLSLQLWDNPAAVGDRQQAVELRISSGEAQARAGGGSWQKVDDSSHSFAPAGDAATFLLGARNVTYLGSESRDLPDADGEPRSVSFERYAFTLNGEQIAEQMRLQAESHMRARGELPPGVALSSGDPFKNAVSRGEAWIAADGLPIRLDVAIEYPQQRNGERLLVNIRTDFSDQSRAHAGGWRNSLAALFTALPAGRHAPATPSTPFADRLPLTLFTIVLGGLALQFLRLRNDEQPLYRAFAWSMALQMATAPMLPLIQSRTTQQLLAAVTPALDAQQATPAAPAAPPAAWNSLRSPLQQAAAPAAARAMSDLLAGARTTGADADEDGLEDALEAIWLTDADLPDSDGDGVSDGNEVNLCPDRNLPFSSAVNADDPICSNPNDADTDDDGLTDAQEILYLGTFANAVDTDHDSLADFTEVKGFLNGGVRYYSNPRSADTNADGLTDGIECDLLLVPAVWSATSSCNDTDGDATPDILDLDNDDDGAPDTVDLSPFAASGVTTPFDRDNPLSLEIDSGAGEPLLVDLQIRPQNPQHLTYARNVLDWPTGDDDGQIQRRLNTTFADISGSADPRDAAGDMRITPVLEITMLNDTTDLPRINASRTVTLGSKTAYAAAVTLGNSLPSIQRSGVPSVTVDVGTVNGDSLTLTVAAGSCSDSAPIWSSPIVAGSRYYIAGVALGDVADGGHTITLAVDGATSCQAIQSLLPGRRSLPLLFRRPVEPLAVLEAAQNGAVTDFSFNFSQTGGFDVSLYEGDCQTYGALVTSWPNLQGSATRTISANLVDLADGSHILVTRQNDRTLSCNPLGNLVNGSLPTMVDLAFYESYNISIFEDSDGTLRAYVPLSISSDPVTGERAGFQGRMVYHRAAAGMLSHSVNLIWWVTALTEYCSPTSCTPDEANQLQVIHHYSDEPWHLTGLELSEELGSDVLIAYEAPALDDNPDYDDLLWHLARALQERFISGADLNGDDQRDVTLANLPARLGGSDGDARWGIPQNAIASSSSSYDGSDGIGDLITGGTAALLDATFAVNETPTLLFANESRYRRANLDGADSLVNGATVSADLSAVDPVTFAGLVWGTYRHDGDRWQLIPAATMWDLLDVALIDSDAFDIGGSGNQDIAFGARADRRFAQMTYMALALATGQIVVNGSQLTSAYREARLLSDAELAAIASNAYNDGELESGSLMLASIAPLLDLAAANYDAFQRVRARGDRTLLQEYDPDFRTQFGASLSGQAQGPLAQFLTGFRPNAPQTISVDLYDHGPIGRLANAVLVGVESVRTIDPTVATVKRIFLTVSGTLRLGSKIVEGAMVGLLYSSASLSGLVSAGTKLATFRGALNAASGASIIGVVTLVLASLAAIGIFIAEVVTSGLVAFSLEFNQAAASLVSSILVAVLLFALSLTGIGLLVVLIIGIIDGLIALICGIAPPADDSFAADWVCGGITGLLSKAVSFFIYAQTDIVSVDDPGRLEVIRFDPRPADPSKGFAGGAKLALDLTLRNTIETSPIPVGIGALYAWQFNDSRAKTASFAYGVTNEPGRVKLHDSIERGDDSADWEFLGGDRFSIVKQVSDDTSISLPTAGINQPIAAYLAEGYATPTQECLWILIAAIVPPVCYVRTRKDTIFTDLNLIFDIFPQTLDGFYQLTAKDGGYALAWGQTGAVTFPRLHDADGDGLPYSADPGDNIWDSDGDGLNDLRERQLNTNLQNPDSDGDTLSDRDEIRYGTNPHQADSDFDGATDAAEIAGWLLGYGFESGQPLQTRVFGDPLQANADGDDYLDGRELALGFHPFVHNTSKVLAYDTRLSEPNAPALLLHFDETAGATSFAASGGSGVISCPQSCPLAGILGKRSNALLFDGDDHLTVDGVPLAQSTTIATWIWPDSFSGTRRILSSGTLTAGAGFSFGLNGNRPFLRLPGGVYSADTTLAAEWTHLAVEFDTAGRALPTFFVNGTPASTAAYGDWVKASLVNDADLVIGGLVDATTATNFYQGRLDDLVLYHSGGLDIDRLLQGVHNLDDAVFARSQQVQFDSVIENTLFNRSADGLLTTDLPSNIFAQSDDATNFQLGPQQQLSETLLLDVQALAADGEHSIEQTAGAIIDIPPKPEFFPTGVVYQQAGQLAGDGRSYTKLESAPNLNGTDFTLAAWIKPSAGSGLRGLMGHSGGNKNAYPTLHLDGRQFSLGFGTGSVWTFRETGDILTYDVWQHVAAAFDWSTAEVTFYHNGAVVSTHSFGGQRPSSPFTRFEIGRANAPSVRVSRFEIVCEGDAGSWGEYDVISYSPSDGYRNLWSGSGGNGTVWSDIGDWYSFDDKTAELIICEDDDGDRTSCSGGDEYMGTINFNNGQASQQWFGRTYMNSNGCVGLDDDEALLDYQISTHSRPFIGSIKDLRIYDQELSAGDVALLHLSDTIIAEYRLDDRPGSTNFADEIAQHEGSCTSDSCPVSGLPGRSNQALHFDGVDDYIAADSVSDAANINDLSFGGWVRADRDLFAAQPSGAAIFGFHSSGGGNRGFLLLTPDSDPDLFNIAYYDDGGERLASSNAYPLGRWIHIMIVLDDNVVDRLYVDGVYSGTFDSPHRPDPGGRFTIGADWDPSGSNQYFKGLIDQVTVQRRALSAAQVQSLVDQAPAANLHLDQATTHFLRLHAIDVNAVPSDNMNIDLFFDGVPLFELDDLDIGETGNYPININTAIPLGGAVLEVEIWATDAGTLYLSGDDPLGLSQTDFDQWGLEMTLNWELIDGDTVAALPAAAVGGQMNRAFDFDGDDDSLALGDVTRLNQLEYFDSTIVAWVNIEATGADELLPIVGTESQLPNLTFGLKNSSLYYRMSGDGTTIAQMHITDVPIAPGIWQHVAVRRQLLGPDEQITFFVNGSEVARFDENYHVDFPAAPLLLGKTCLTSNCDVFEGRLDEVAIYRQALTNQEIARIFHYQNSWFDESRRSNFSIDATDPAVSLDFAQANLPLAPTMLLLTSDEAASAGLLDVTYAGGSFQIDAPVCTDSEDGGTLCPLFDPPVEGVYTLTPNVFDQVGNLGVGAAQALLVDGSPPNLTIDAPPALLQPQLQNGGATTLPLSGTVSDPLINSSAGSGVAQLLVTLRDANGLVLGQNDQVAAVDGGSWTIDYVFDAQSGGLIADVIAIDHVGNQTVATTTLHVDATSPQTTIETFGGARSQVGLLGSDDALAGSSSDHPPNTAQHDVVAGVEQTEIAVIPLHEHGSPFVNTPLPGDVRVYLPLDKSAAVSETVDSSFVDLVDGATATCTAAGCPLAGVASRNGQALHFDGVDDRLQLPHQPGVGDLTSDIFVAAWIRVDRLHQGTIAGSARSNSNNGYRFGVSANGALFFTTWGVKDYSSSAAVLPVNRWVHVAAYLDGNNDVTFYRNGRPISTDPGSSPAIADTDDAMLIGAATAAGTADLTQLFQGDIDELTIAGAAPNAARWQAIFGQAPVVHLAFDQTSSRSFNDSAGMATTVEPTGPDYPMQTGKVGPYAAPLRSDNTYTVADAGGVLPQNEEPHTISFWVNNRSNSVTIRFQGGNTHEIAAGGANLVHTGDDLSTLSAAPLTTGWRHVAFVWDGVRRTFYVDGIEAAGGSGGVDVATPTHVELLGQDDELDDLRIYRRALDPLEIAALAQSSWHTAADAARSEQWRAVLPSGLEGYYALEARSHDAVGNVEVDLLQSDSWQGSIDTLQPRITLDVSGETYTMTVTDFNLVRSTVKLPPACAQTATVIDVSYQSPWLLAFDDQLGGSRSTPDRAYQTIATCSVSGGLTSADLFSACDLAANCSAVDGGGAAVPLAIAHSAANSAAVRLLHLLPLLAAALLLATAALRFAHAGTRCRKPS